MFWWDNPASNLRQDKDYDLLQAIENRSQLAVIGICDRNLRIDKRLKISFFSNIYYTTPPHTNPLFLKKKSLKTPNPPLVRSMLSTYASF